MSKKKKINIVYSTNPDHVFDYEEQADEETRSPEDQKLKVYLDRKNRKGKTVTIISGFVGSEADLKELEKELKSKCGVGGSSKNGDIIMQGAFKEKIHDLLLKMGYGVKMSGG